MLSRSNKEYKWATLGALFVAGNPFLILIVSLLRIPWQKAHSNSLSPLMAIVEQLFWAWLGASVVALPLGIIAALFVLFNCKQPRWLWLSAISLIINLGVLVAAVFLWIGIASFGGGS